MSVAPVPMLQMVARQIPVGDIAGPTCVVLTAHDIDAMMELVALTKPGPFEARTLQLGTYLGLREGGRLLAMAGERLRVPGYVELSAICTHPEARGRGLAAYLCRLLMLAAADRREVPFLHVRPENPAAELYRRLGFEVRRQLWVLWRKPVAESA